MSGELLAGVFQSIPRRRLRNATEDVRSSEDYCVRSDDRRVRRVMAERANGLSRGAVQVGRQNMVAGDRRRVLSVKGDLVSSSGGYIRADSQFAR